MGLNHERASLPFIGTSRWFAVLRTAVFSTREPTMSVLNSAVQCLKTGHSYTLRQAQLPYVYFKACLALVPEGQTKPVQIRNLSITD